MAKEIERKFLVRGTGWQMLSSSASRLRQAYILCAEDRSTRVRIIDGNQAMLAVKIGRNSLVRDEFEYEIPIEDAHGMMENALGRIIEKTRYVVPFAGRRWEVDVYSGFYEGLIVAEIELTSVADQVTLPGWLGREVTADRNFSNLALAMRDLRSVIGTELAIPA